MTEQPEHKVSKGPQAEPARAASPIGRSDPLWMRASAALDRRLCSVSQKMSLASALLLCATPLLLVHASAPPRTVADIPPTAEVPKASAPDPAIEIVRTRPVTAAAPAPQAQGNGVPQAPAAVGSQSKAAPSPQPSTAPPPAANQPAAPQLPPAWSDADIAAARAQCGALLGPLQVTVQELPPLKQDRCGTPAPIALKTLGPATGGIELTPPAVLNCAMVVQLAAFVDKTLQPAAREVFGSPVVRFNQASGYVCRGRNGDLMANGKMSEHALANALDVASFTLADGRVIDVGKHWGPAARDFKTSPAAVASAQQIATPQTAKNPERQGLGAPTTSPTPAKAAAPDAAATRTKEALFLRRLHQGACALFGTVLGPEANEAHREHFHFDLHQRRHSNYCQ